MNLAYNYIAWTYAKTLKLIFQVWREESVWLGW